MNVLERALIEKVGREQGWEVVIESLDARVMLGSARHRGRAGITAPLQNGGWRVQLPGGRLARELTRTLPDLVRDADAFEVQDRDALAALLRRAAELSQSLPDQAAQTFRERSAAALAGVVSGGTEVERVVRQRLGQEVFREALLDYWGGACAITGLALPDVLRASHAKPWAVCASDEERLDVFNGFLLAAHLDALFDRGLISFDDDGGMFISDRVSEAHRAHLHLDSGLRLRWVAPEHLPYLRWHREHEFGRSAAVAGVPTRL